MYGESEILWVGQQIWRQWKGFLSTLRSFSVYEMDPVSSANKKKGDDASISSHVCCLCSDTLTFKTNKNKQKGPSLHQLNVLSCSCSRRGTLLTFTSVCVCVCVCSGGADGAAGGVCWWPLEGGALRAHCWCLQAHHSHLWTAQRLWGYSHKSARSHFGFKLSGKGSYFYRPPNKYVRLYV